MSSNNFCFHFSFSYENSCVTPTTKLQFTIQTNTNRNHVLYDITNYSIEPHHTAPEDMVPYLTILDHIGLELMRISKLPALWVG